MSPLRALLIGWALSSVLLTGCGDDGSGGAGGSGGSAADPEWVTLGLPINDVGDVTVPPEVRDYMQRRGWGYAHERWHNERTWDMANDAVRAQRLANGYAPFDKIQQGVVGSGVEFLAMHRHMFREVRAEFPEYTETLWRGWEKIPRERQSELVPMDAVTDLSESAVAALERLENDEELAKFGDDEEFGLYIWTNRYVVGNAVPLATPVPTSAEEGAGIHDLTLHQRWARGASDVALNEFSLTHENYIFWKMHGWIDDRWSRFRELKGLPETDEETEARIDAQGMEMMQSAAHVSEEVAAELASHEGAH